MKTALYPGTFDPVTLGHIDIFKRAAALVDRLVIGIAVNSDKAPLFDLDERVRMVEAQIKPISNKIGIEIVTHPFENLLIDCAEEVGASMIIRGLRAVSDFEYEYSMVGMNRMMNEKIETVFLMSDLKYQSIASKLVKEIARLGGDISNFVPDEVHEKLLKKLM